MAKSKKKGNPIVVGLVILGASIGALWKNEHRFDYHKAAEKTIPVEDIGGLARDTLFSQKRGQETQSDILSYSAQFLKILV